MLPEIWLLTPAKTREWYDSLQKLKKSVHLNLTVYRASNARTHGSYILRSTTRNSTQSSWEVPFEKNLSPKV